jgi:hypothetical protein
MLGQVAWRPLECCTNQSFEWRWHPRPWHRGFFPTHNALQGWEEAASSWAGQAIKLNPASAALLQVKGASWKDVLAEEDDKPVQWELYGVVGPKGFTPAAAATGSQA